MALYGSIEAVKQLLRPQPGVTFNADVDSRLAALQATISLLIERETGRVFAGSADPETQIIVAPGVSPYLILPKPIRSLTSVAVGGTWNGTAYTGGELLPNTAYRLVWPNEDGEYAGIIAVGSPAYWSGVVAVTGIWFDAPPDAVPADITYIANYLMAEQFKIEEAGPHGIIGADGHLIQVRKLLGLEIVRQTLDHYRRCEVVV